MKLNSPPSGPQERIICSRNIIWPMKNLIFQGFIQNKVGLNQFPGCEKRFTSDEEVSVNMWLESAPKTVRKIRFKTDHYIVNDN